MAGCAIASVEQLLQFRVSMGPRVKPEGKVEGVGWSGHAENAF